jgi:hypothetical protein
MAAATPPEDLLRELVALDPALTLRGYYGERAVFYNNPGRPAPLGVIVASVKDRDGPNDRRANLSRPAVYRLAFGLTRTIFAEPFGDVPARPPNGGVVALPDHDLTALDQCSQTQHPTTDSHRPPSAMAVTLAVVAADERWAIARPGKPSGRSSPEWCLETTGAHALRERTRSRKRCPGSSGQGSSACSPEGSLSEHRASTDARRGSHWTIRR